MRKSVIFILFLMVFSVASGQVLFRYPKGQKPYNGDFYKDFHQVLKDNHIKPCENKKELYNVRVLVNEDGRVNIVRDVENSRMQNNQCTIEVLKEVLPKMKGWVPARVDGQNVKATTTFIIYLDDLFNYKEGYKLRNYITESSFKGEEINKFRQKVANRAYRRADKYTIIIEAKLEVAFEINENGEISNAFIVETSGNEEFDKEFIDAIMSMKDKKWNPLKYRDIPINNYYVFPFTVRDEYK